MQNNRNYEYRKMANTLLATTLPAYLMPAGMSMASALMMGDTRLAEASYTTIAGASAIAAFAVTLYCLFLRPPVGKSLWAVATAAGVGALASVMVAGAVSILLYGLGIFDQSIFEYAPVSAGIGGGIAAAGWRRSGARVKKNGVRKTPLSPPSALGMSLLVLAIGSSQVGCVSTVNALPPANFGLQAYPPSGVEGRTWSTYLDLAELCSVWADVAEREAGKSGKHQMMGAIVSSVSGYLGLAAGATGAVLTAREDDDKKALALSTTTGITAMSFGILATIGGYYAGRSHTAEVGARRVAGRIRRALTQHSLQVFSLTSIERDAGVQEAGASLGFLCAQEARTLEPLKSLPTGIAVRSGSAGVARHLASTEDIPSLKIALFATGGSR